MNFRVQSAGISPVRAQAAPPAALQTGQADISRQKQSEEEDVPGTVLGLAGINRSGSQEV